MFFKDTFLWIRHIETLRFSYFAETHPFWQKRVLAKISLSELKETTLNYYNKHINEKNQQFKIKGI